MGKHSLDDFEKIYIEARKEKKLFKPEPVYWLWLPKPMRLILAYITITLFALSFYALPAAFLLVFPWTWRTFPLASSLYAISLIISYILPPREWPWARKIGQLWYEYCDFSCNVPPEYCAGVTRDNQIIKGCEKEQLILGMHPHGIVPFQAVLWAAFCDQHYRYEDKELYGFGAAADVVGYLPFLRNIMVRFFCL